MVVVVVQAYSPGAEFNPEDAVCQNYSQLLGLRASKVTEGTPVDRWRLKMPPSKPTADAVRHSKRLLMTDLETHLMFYALNPNCTIVLMGDANVDIHSRPGTDTDSYRMMMAKLGLMSCGEARWPGGLHKSSKTRQGGAGQNPSHIDYMLISESSASAVRSFGVWY